MTEAEIHQRIRSAIRGGETEAAQRLIAADPARLRMITPFGTWLHVAIAFGRHDLAKWLIEAGCDVNRQAGVFDASAVHEAASKGDMVMLRHLLEKGAVLDTSLSQRNPLFGAIQGGHIEAVRFLLDAGIDASIKYTSDTMKGMDAYAFAVERGQTDIALLLQS